MFMAILILAFWGVKSGGILQYLVEKIVELIKMDAVCNFDINLCDMNMFTQERNAMNNKLT